MPTYQAWARQRGPFAHPNKLLRCPDLPGRTEGVRGGAGSAWKSSGTLARVRTKVEPTSAAHVPSGTGRSGWELHSAGRTKTRMHSLRPPRGVHSPGGKLQWPLGRGLGPGGRPGGRGAAGSPEPSLFARFPSTMAAPLFPLSSSSSALPAAASRCLCLQAARPPSLGHRAPLQGRRERQGPALTLTHTGTLRHTQRPPAPSFLPFSPSSLPLLPARSPSLSPKEAPGRAEGGAAPPAPPPPRERGGRAEGGSEEGLLRKTKEIETGDWGPKGSG